MHLVLISLWNAAAGTERARETEAGSGGCEYSHLLSFEEAAGLHFELQGHSVLVQVAVPGGAVGGPRNPSPLLLCLADKPNTKQISSLCNPATVALLYVVKFHWVSIGNTC